MKKEQQAGGGLSNKVLGLWLLLSTAVIWTVSSFLSNSLVSSSTATGQAKVPPFLLTYLATTLFTLYLPLIQLRTWFLQ